MEATRAALQKFFGYESFRPPQDLVIQTVLTGRDCFVLMPTGGGKSLCYQVPALLKHGTAIVVSPLISLMKDQVDALRQNGISAECLNSGLSEREARGVLAKLHSGSLSLLYVAPERLMMPEFQERLKRVSVTLVAIDEAHCVSQWGHDFRPEYVQLGEFRERLPEIPFVALTATADRQTREDVLIRLRLKDPAVFVSGFDRPNIRYGVVEKSRPAEQLARFVEARPNRSGIVYCLSRKRVEEVAQTLRGRGISAQAYHAGMSASDRSRVQEAFQNDAVEVVVATVAFGMGIDKPNVRYVVHYDLPKNIESYYQETGRAGRDGLDSEALLLYGMGDIRTARHLIEQNGNAEQKQIELRKLRSLVDFAEAQQCRRRLLVGYFGEVFDRDCGNCDNCLHAPEQYDATQDVVDALMAVYELKQRYGMHHVVEVLRGSGSTRLLQLGHDKLKCYGSGKRNSAEHWAGLIRQLVHRGLLSQDQDQYAVLKLTPATRPILREGERVTLAKPRLPAPAKRGSKSKQMVVVSGDEALFQRLRELRKTIAEEEHVPPYVVFGDVTLHEMAARKPRTAAQLLAVHGVGETKLARYGERFLVLLRQ